MQVRLSKYRTAIQLFFFGLFIVLSIVDIYRWGTPMSTQLFLYADPLIALVVLITGAPFVLWLMLSLITVAVTVLFGRVFCGYACPVGTILDWFSSLSGLLKIKENKFRILRVLPFVILAAIITLSVFKSSIIMVLDPMSLMARTTTITEEAIKTVVKLAVDVTGPLVSEQFSGDAGFHGSSGSRGTAGAIYTPRFLDSSGWIVALFAAIVGLNLLGKRFWCRYLCPLGGLLGLLSRVPLFRRKVDTNLCTSCLKCKSVCDMGAITQNGHATDPTNCTLCLECRDKCPENAISWGLKPELSNEVPSRRTALAVIGGTVVAAAAIPVTGRFQEEDAAPLRPPGVSNEELFLQKCIRCGQCISKCPTKALQPSLLQYGVGSLWTPHVDYSAGVCDYYCNMCGAVCPTGAIEYLILERKQRFVMGIAEIDKKTCIRFLNGFGCGLCARVCPVPGGAIKTDVTYDNFGAAGKLSSGMPLSINEEKCVGCGVCEAVCPVKGTKAIKVVRRRVGEEALRNEAQPQQSFFD